ncbi:expressed unknown protein [Seminavis robusta]|uniref:Cupin type-1 domain-containing protein n=1 Tax=Seminavis robusta TaxID=568900 RepID=A0A9N8DZ11_9STRA|nr:expressed unknown protein [Seminavis robusta]|eukprot:Sro460_g147430.1 n/a (557) ;mRNA; f:15477-17147
MASTTHVAASSTTFLGSRPVTGGINTVTQRQLVHDVKVPQNRFNDGCGGHVWAIGDLANSTNLISGTPASAEHLEVFDDVALSIVYFDLNPCGVHPWHIHQNMDEYVFVARGSGIVSIMSPYDQSIEMLAVSENDLVTLPESYLHQFEASSEGLELVAFGSVNEAHLALLPLYMAMQPEPVQQAVNVQVMPSGTGTGLPNFFSQSYPWTNNMENGPGAAFVCANITEDPTNCPLRPETPGQYCTRDSQTGNQQCTVYDGSNDKYYPPFQSVASCASPDPTTTGCTCQFDGAVCQLQPARATVTDMLYARLQLEQGAMIGPALQARGGIGGYVTKGRIWVMFLSPNFGYASQFVASQGQSFYIPPDVFVNILGMDQDNAAVMGVSRKKDKLQNEVGIFVPVGPALNVVPANVLHGYFGWDDATAASFAASASTTSIGNKSMVPELISWVEQLTPDQVLCPATNEFCTGTEPMPDTTLVYDNVPGTASHTINAELLKEEADNMSSGEKIAIAALVIATVDFFLLLLVLLRGKKQEAPGGSPEDVSGMTSPEDVSAMKV